MNTIDVVKSAPLSKRLFAIELAAYEQLELIAPRKPALETDEGLCFPSFSTMSKLDPKAWIIPEIEKPITKAQNVS